MTTMIGIESKIYFTILYKKDYILKNKEHEFFERIKQEFLFNKTFKENFKGFFLGKGIKRTNHLYYYLYRKEKLIKELDLKKSPKENNCKEGDIIKITEYQIKIPDEKNVEPQKKDDNVINNKIILKENININSKKISQEMIPTQYEKSTKENINKTKETKKENEMIYTAKNKSVKIIKIILISFIITVLLSVLFLIIYLILRKKKKEIEETKPNEILQANIDYKVGQIYLYKSKERTDVFSQGEKDTNTTNFNEYKYYLLLIKEEHSEIISKEDIKTYYSGFFSLYNSYVDNNTHLILSQSDDKVNEILENNPNNLNLRLLSGQEFIDGHSTNITHPIIKLEFYKNGIIKNLYIPEGFNMTFLQNMKSLLNSTIPKLSKNYYVQNIEEELKSTSEAKNKQEEINDKNKETIRGLQDIQDKEINYINNTYNTQNSFSSEAPDEVEINMDLMQSERIVNEKNEILNKITEVKLNNVHNEYASMEGGQSNTTTIFYINENTSRLEYIEEVNRLFLSGQDNDDNNNIDSIYDNNNQINFEDISTNMTEDKIKLESRDFIVDTIRNINCSEPINDESKFNKLLDYFNNYNYLYYEENKTKDINLRLLAMKESIARENNINPDDININIKKSNLRYISEESNNDAYYGLKYFIDSRETFVVSAMGLKINQKIYSKIDPSTGILSTYIDINVGKTSIRINYPEYQTNLNIIIQNTNQLSYKLIQLMIETNMGLKDKNQKIIKPITEMEINTTKMLNNYSDFSEVLKEPLNTLYDEIKNFTTDSFLDLIDLIYKAHNNFSSVINDVKKNKYEKFNEIIEIIKNEYINYIEKMTNNLEIFHNRTLIYINNIQNEFYKANDFEVNLLYDIIDSIQESKEQYEVFNTKLFNSIEKGIIQLKYDLNNHFEKIIGNLIYITDFLSININQNEILIKAIEEEKRKEIQLLLKDFRGTINQIIDLLMDNIQSDYINEFSETKEDSLKFKNIKIVKDFLSNVTDNSKELIEEIKGVIDFMNYYELYSNNLDIIDKINNKTLTEFNNDFYNGCLQNLTDIKPDFYENNNSEIIQYKEKLFNISDEIKNKINSDITEINNYIISFSDNYLQNNFFKMYNNLYNFKKVFTEKEMNNLLNQFLDIIKHIYKNIFTNNIKNNFDLAREYVDEENALQDLKEDKWHRYATTDFRDRIKEFLSNSKNYLSQINQNFQLSYDKYFYKIRDNILNNIDKQMKSFKKYYFDSELYKDNFYFIEQMNNEIYTISNNIKNFFNEINLKNRIRIKSMEWNNDLDIYYYSIYPEFYNYFDKVLYRGTFWIIKKRDGDDLEYWDWKWLFGGWKHKGLRCEHRDNVYKIVNNLDDAYNYFETKSNEIINNFNNKYKSYLSELISINQKLFDSLNNYIKNKINENNIQVFSIKYRDLFNEMKLKFYNYEKLKEKYKIDEFDSYITNLEINLNLIINDFYSVYYLNNKTDYLKYPVELIPKIEYIQNQLKKIKEPIKEKINYIYNYKLKQTYNIIYELINDANKYNQKYILNTINFTYILDDYKKNKLKIINDMFNNIQIEKMNNINEINLLTKFNYDNPIDKILYNISEFIHNFEKEINNTFIILDNNTDTFTSDSLIVNISQNLSEINNSKLNDSNYSSTNESFNDSQINETENGKKYSKYNFNVIKIKNSLFYSKNIIKNLYNLFDEFNFDYFINDNLINYLDKIINDKGIIEIYDKSNTKLRQINKETSQILKPIYESFIKAFSSRFSYENDYYSCIQIFRNILSLSNKNYLSYTEQFNKINLNDIEKLFYMVNQTLNAQISLNTTNDFPININYLRNYLISLNESIKTIINNNKNSINNMKSKGDIYKVLRNSINVKIKEKIEYSKNQIDNYLQKYEIKFINYSINLGEYVAKYMKKQYDDYNFQYIYDYVESFGSLNNYWKYIDKDTINVENNIFSKFKNLYNYFYINYISNKNVNNQVKNNNNNETEQFNITKYQFNYKNNTDQLELISHNITKLIEKLKKDDYYLYNYLVEEEKLDYYKFTLNDISNSFMAFDDYRPLINNKKNPEYRDLLKSSLIFYFNKSYTEYINNYLSDYIVSNVDILINEKLSLSLDLIKNKISDDFQFYKLILNGTNLLSDSVKLSFMKLYSDLKLKINETINNHLDYHLFFNLEQLKNNTKKLFINKFLEFYSLDEKKHVNIYQSKEILFDLIKDISFNQTLDNIYENIFNKSIKDKINSILKNEVYNKLGKLFELIDLQNTEINNLLKEIPGKEISKESNQTYYLIDEYNKLVKNYNMKFLFSFSEKPFLITNDFSDENLKPPLLTIKNKYSEIEKELLQQIFEKLNEINSFSSIIKNNLNLDTKINYINNFIEKIKSFMFDYYSYFINDIDQYYCKLAYFTIIDEQDYVNQPHNFSYCNISLELNKNLRELNENDDNDDINISKYFKKIPEINISRINNIKRKLGSIEGEYNSNSPSLTRDDIIFFYLFFNETLNKLFDDVMNNTAEMKNALNNSINEILNKYLPNLKTTIDITETKFSSILTEENMNILYENMYKGYNEINNVSQNYTSLISEKMEPLLNSLNNTKIFLDLMKNFAFNLIMETSNKNIEQIQSKTTKTMTSNNKLSMNKKAIQNLNNKIDSDIEGIYSETKEIYDKIRENYGKPMIKLNNIIFILDLDNEELLKVIQKDILKNKNISLVSSIARYELQKIKNKTKELTYITNIPSIAINFDDINLSYFIPFIIRPVFQLVDIKIEFVLGVRYLYDKDDKETPTDMQIYQKFKVNMIAKADVNTYIPFGLNDMSISFSLSGTLSNYKSETIIEINCLANTYSILLWATNSYLFDYFLFIIMIIRVLFLRVPYIFYLYCLEMGLYIPDKIFYKLYSFRDPLLDTSILKKVSLFSSYDIDLQSLSGLY